MDNLQRQLEDYAEEHSSSPHKQVLEALERKTNLEVMYPQMLSGKVQGQLLSLLSNMQRPLRILEIGTYTGYSAICLASGLQQGGLLHTIEINAEIIDIAQEFFEKAGLKQNIIQHQGDALDVLNTLQESWDLVFLDADKMSYEAYYDAVFPNVVNGGLIIADNVLWKGMVLHSKEKRARALDAYNKKVLNDPRVHNLLLPFRDGLMIAQKIN